MQIRNRCLLWSMSWALVLVWVTSAMSYSGGNGTADYPYQIGKVPAKYMA